MEEIIYLIIGLVAGIGAIVFGRDFFGGGGVSGSDAAAGKLKDSVDESADVSGQMGGVASDIGKDNRTAISGIERALSILKGAKKRTNNKSD